MRTKRRIGSASGQRRFCSSMAHYSSGLRTTAEKRENSRPAVTTHFVKSSKRTFDRTLTAHLCSFISEGTAAEKSGRIATSPYLSFCFRKWKDSSRPLTVLGHSLSDADSYLVDELKSQPGREISIGLWSPHKDRRKRSEDLKEQAHQMRGRLSSCSRLKFFDSFEHPLIAAARNE